jgi:4-hydroxy-2-oxoheptanedioate aldolase
MPLTNTFKHALASGQAQIGLWCTLASPYAAELVAGSGFDWLLLDTEHTPADVPLVLQQLQAVAAEPLHRAHPVVRAAWNDPVLIKRILDIGAQTLLLPFVQNADEARAAVAAMRYAPRGIRGMGGTMRASHYGRDVDYVRDAESELCLLVQVETAEALAQLEAIAAVDGVDGIFIGPADLSASMGHPGNAGHPEVRAAIDDAIRRIRAAGKAPGILMVDLILLRNAADGLAAAFRPGARGAVQTAY